MRGDDPAKAGLSRHGADQLDLRPGQVDRGRNHREVLVLAARRGNGGNACALDDGLVDRGGPPVVGHSQRRGRVALRVEVDHQHPLPQLGQGHREVHRGRGLPHPALLVGDDHDARAPRPGHRLAVQPTLLSQESLFDGVCQRGRLRFPRDLILGHLPRRADHARCVGLRGAVLAHLIAPHPSAPSPPTVSRETSHRRLTRPGGPAHLSVAPVRCARDARPSSAGTPGPHPHSRPPRARCRDAQGSRAPRRPRRTPTPP